MAYLTIAVVIFMQHIWHAPNMEMCEDVSFLIFEVKSPISQELSNGMVCHIIV